MDKEPEFTAMWNIIKCSKNFYNGFGLMPAQLRQSVYDDREMFTDEDGLSYASLTGGQ